MSEIDFQGMLDKLPHDPEYAALSDYENACAAWTPAEMRDAAHLCVELAALTRRQAHACEALLADIVAFDHAVPEDYHSVFGGVLLHHRQVAEGWVELARAEYESMTRNIRAAGALLWLAEQREAGHTR